MWRILALARAGTSRNKRSWSWRSGVVVEVAVMAVVIDRMHIDTRHGASSCLCLLLLDCQLARPPARQLDAASLSLAGRRDKTRQTRTGEGREGREGRVQSSSGTRTAGTNAHDSYITYLTYIHTI